MVVLEPLGWTLKATFVIARPCLRNLEVLRRIRVAIPCGFSGSISDARRGLFIDNFTKISLSSGIRVGSCSARATLFLISAWIFAVSSPVRIFSME